MMSHLLGDAMPFFGLQGEPAQTPLFEKLFADENKIKDLLAQLKLKVSRTACQGDGAEKDGSADLQNREICVAYPAFRKMSDSESINHLSFLMVHETSHFLGFGEKEAMELQKFLENEHEWALSILNGSSISTSPLLQDLTHLNKVNSISFHYSYALVDLAVALAHADSTEICQRWNDVEKSLSQHLWDVMRINPYFELFKRSLKRFESMKQLGPVFCTSNIILPLEKRKQMIGDLQLAANDLNDVLWKSRKFWNLSMSSDDWRCAAQVAAPSSRFAQAYSEMQEEPAPPPPLTTDQYSCTLMDKKTGVVLVRFSGPMGIEPEGFELQGVGLDREKIWTGARVGRGDRSLRILLFNPSMNLYMKSDDPFAEDHRSELAVFVGPLKPVVNVDFEIYRTLDVAIQTGPTPSALTTLKLNCQYRP